MGLFDIENNITKIAFNSVFKSVCFSVTSRLSSTELFFIENETELHPLYRDRNNYELFRKLRSVSSDFTKELDNIDFQIDIRDNIPTQLGELLKTITDIPFTIDQDCYHFFIINKHSIFQTARGQFEIRRRCGMDGFSHPENIGYVHFIFNENIHWYYPIEYTMKS